MASGPITSWEIDGETVETVSDFILGGSKITADDDDFLTFWKESCDQPRQHIKKQRQYFANKCPYSQRYGFSSTDVRVGPYRRLSTEELMLLNCGVGEDS